MYLQDHNLTIYLWQWVVTGDLQQDVIKIIIQLWSCTNIILNYSVSSSPHYCRVLVNLSRAKSSVSCWNGLILHSPDQTSSTDTDHLWGPGSDKCVSHCHTLPCSRFSTFTLQPIISTPKKIQFYLVEEQEGLEVKNSKKYLESLEYLKTNVLHSLSTEIQKTKLVFSPSYLFQHLTCPNPAPVHHTCWSSQVTWSRSTFILNTNTTPTTWKQIELVSDGVIQQHIRIKHV